MIDNVPSLIDLKFVKAISRGVQNFLVHELGLGSSDAQDRCTGFLAEDPLVVARREELSARKQRLDKVQLELHTFGL